MKGAKAKLTALAVFASLISGCSTSTSPGIEPEQQALSVQQPATSVASGSKIPEVSDQGIEPNPDFKPEITTIQPVNNDGQAVNTCNREPGSGVIMTFDDFGTPQQIEAILDTLNELNWRAAFFLTGDWVLDNRGSVQAIQEEGHIVGSHTMTHQDLVELYAADVDEFYTEIEPISNFATTSPRLLRPPYGSGLQDSNLAKVMDEQNTQLCGWTADTNDWRGGTASEMLTRVMDGYEFSPQPLQPDGIVLAHMHGEHSVEFTKLLAAELDKLGWHREPLEK